MRIDYKMNLMVLISTTLLVVVLMAAAVLSFNSLSKENLKMAEKFLMNNKINQVKMMVNTAHTLGTNATDKAKLIKDLSLIRYSGGSGYFFAYEKKQDGYYFGFHGVKKQLNGKKTNIDKPDPKGFAFRRALIEAADKNSDGGFAEYHYKNPKTGAMSKKIAFARKIPKWNWYVVTGIYMDDVAEEIGKLEEFNEEGKNSFVRSSVIAAAVMLIIILAIVAIFVRKYSGTIIDLTKRLSHLAGETKKVADVVSDRSIKFSNSTQEQSSSLEESSASLEELDKMIQENMQSSDQTNQAAEDVKNISNEGNSAMKQALAAIQDIIEGNKEVEELAKVIEEIGDKTSIIDDIVFQTKLLSFNASVEAERAGEHGRGFAVVAQEVGSLAELSGKAAREISSIVRGSVSKAKAIVTDNQDRVTRGNDLVGTTADKLVEIESRAGSVSEQITNIVSASKEQSLGISQINEAVSHLDKAVQENAGNADDVATVGKELVEFADNLATIAVDLDSLMTGKRKV